MKKIAMTGADDVGLSPSADTEIEDFLPNRKLNFHVILTKAKAYDGVRYVIIAAPTVYDPEAYYFNTNM